MATLWNLFPCKCAAALSIFRPPANPNNPLLISSSTPPFMLSIFASSSSTSSFAKSSSRLMLITNKSNRPVFLLRAADDERSWRPEEGAEDYGVAVVSPSQEEEEEERPEEVTEIDRLKKQLVDSVEGTNRGLKANSDQRAEILELIMQLEAKNPTPAPTEALILLHGKWILAYTSFAALFPLLSGETLPILKVDEISQTIDSENFTVQNSVHFSWPLATTSISTIAKFEVRSPKRVQIKFEEGIIGTPQLTDSIELPENVEFLGQKMDLAPFKSIITSVKDAASSVAKTISSQPPLKFSISYANAQSWLLTTYLDEDLRISRADSGNVFVLIKDGSPLLKPRI